MIKIKRNSSDSNGVTAPLLDPNTNGAAENDERIVEPFLPLDPDDPREPYPPNIITTSRYSLFSFLPKTIFEQFRRLANVYFLVLGGIAAIGANTEYYDTAVEPAGLLIPMSIVVLISIIKDGIEDIKRHRTDNKTNNRLTRLVERDVGSLYRLSPLLNLFPLCLSLSPIPSSLLEQGQVKISEWKHVVVGRSGSLLSFDD
jgi:hypothetical protein